MLKVKMILNSRINVEIQVPTPEARSRFRILIITQELLNIKLNSKETVPMTVIATMGQALGQMIDKSKVA
jgi:hypothetical protein